MMRPRLVMAVLLVLGAELGLACGSGGSASNGGGGATCTGNSGNPSCDFTECGGDIVGTWKLIRFCAPSCVLSVSDSVTYEADGTYSGGGTWETNGSTVTTTVGNASSSATYCVKGDVLWTKRSTNCGPTQPGDLVVVRQRDCGQAGGGGSGAR